MKHGETGFLSEPGNVDEMVRYIRQLTGDNKLKARLKEGCLREVQKFSWDKIIPMLENALVQTMLSTGAR